MCWVLEVAGSGVPCWGLLFVKVSGCWGVVGMAVLDLFLLTWGFGITCFEFCVLGVLVFGVFDGFGVVDLVFWPFYRRHDHQCSEVWDN